MNDPYIPPFTIIFFLGGKELISPCGQLLNVEP